MHDIYWYSVKQLLIRALWLYSSWNNYCIYSVLNPDLISICQLQFKSPYVVDLRRQQGPKTKHSSRVSLTTLGSLVYPPINFCLRFSCCRHFLICKILWFHCFPFESKRSLHNGAFWHDLIQQMCGNFYLFLSQRRI